MRGRRGKNCQIDLGLAVSALSLSYGQTRTPDELAAYCGCTRQQIDNIYQKALRKLYAAHFVRHDPSMQELHDHNYMCPALRAGDRRVAYGELIRPIAL